MGIALDLRQPYIFVPSNFSLWKINFHKSLPALPQRTVMEPKTISSCLLFPETDHYITFTNGNVF